MCIPLVTNIIFDTPAHQMAFTLPPMITFGAGTLLWWCCKSESFALRPREIFLLTNLSWIIVCAFGALPFLFETEISFTDAFFETMSGITTTGSTVLVGLDNMNPGILMWRSVLQWLGGIGFIVMAVAILPFLKVGGMRLFQSESSDWSEKVMPRSGVIAKRIVQVYLGLSVLCALAYYYGGMTAFEAINHSMTTLSTGGFSTSDSSMGFFSNPVIHWTGTLFMLLGSLPFVLMVRFFSGNADPLLKDAQIRGFMKLIVVVWSSMTLWLVMNSDYGVFDALTLVAFNTTSVISTTGFALTDYLLWDGFAATVFFFLTFIGGCSGSTSGGVKIFRFQLGLMLLNVQLKLLSH
nr:potassium transporter TrkG [Endozoicomonas sp.]